MSDFGFNIKNVNSSEPKKVVVLFLCFFGTQKLFFGTQGFFLVHNKYFKKEIRKQKHYFVKAAVTK